MKERILEYMKKQKIELIVFSVLLILSVLVTNSCGTNADLRFLETNQKASQTFGNKLIYYTEKYREEENLTAKNVERRVKSIKAWQDSCKVAVRHHKQQGKPSE